MKTIALCCAILALSLPIASGVQGAWVLWAQPQVLGYIADNMWMPLDAYQDQGECFAFLSLRFRQVKDGSWWRESQFFGKNGWEKGVCLPDTVKIPGKGGAR
jgi:hypothetical protein